MSSSSPTQPSLDPGTQNPTHTFVYARPAPTASSLLSTLSNAYGLPSRIYQDPFYSNPSDRPIRPVEVAAGYSVIIPGTGLGSLTDWDMGIDVDPDSLDGGASAAYDRPQRSPLRIGTLRGGAGLGSGGVGSLWGKGVTPHAPLYANKLGVKAWQYAAEPPGRLEVRKWLANHPSTQAVEPGRGLRAAGI